jgi:hypothetical protein
MFTKLIGAATLFTAGSLMAGTTATVGATTVEPFGAEAAFTQAGECGAKEAKEDGKAPAKDAKAKSAKAKDGSCGKGSCGSKDMKKGKKDGSCGKDKKYGSCGKDKKEADKK